MENSPEKSYTTWGPDEQAGRVISDTELIEGGATLAPTKEQVESAKEQMERERGETKEAREINENITKSLKEEGIVLDKKQTIRKDGRVYRQKFKLPKILVGDDVSFFALHRDVEREQEKREEDHYTNIIYLCMYDNATKILTKIFGLDQKGEFDYDGDDKDERDKINKIFPDGSLSYVSPMRFRFGALLT